MANEKRLIDANALKRTIRMESWKQETQIQLALDYIDIIIDGQPKVDAVEVVHGNWVQTTENLGWADVMCGECSNCHETFIVDEEDSFDDFAMWKYCPNCGAKMDGGNEDG